MIDWITSTDDLTAWTALVLASLSIAISWATRRRIDDATGRDSTQHERHTRDRELRIEVTSEPERPNRPLKLTEHGWSIVNHMDAQTWVQEQTERLKHDITAMKPYEVDIYAHGVLEKHGLFGPKTKRMLPENRELHDKVSESAYEHGASREDVLAAVQVLLRDELLKEQQDANPETESQAA